MPTLDFEHEKAAFRGYYDDHAQRLEQAKQAFLTLIVSLLAHGDIAVAAASGRIKDREESIKKFARKYQGQLERSGTPYEIKDHVTDLIGLRLVCLYEDQIEAMGDLVRPHFNVIEVTDKSAEMEGMENAFGYKGLHLDLELKADRAEMPEYQLFAPYRFELQIRTIIQDSWSTLDHKIQYKKSIPAMLRRRINMLAAIFELADREFRQVREETDRLIEKASAEPDPETGPAGEGLSLSCPETSAETTDEVRRQHAPLDAFRLLRIAQHFFPESAFEAKSVDGFTAEVIDREPTVSRGEFNHYLRTTIAMVRRYRTYFLGSGKGERFNAFTVMRHCLYAAKPEIFSSMLTNVARTSFDAWRETTANEHA
ncbi:hypothetical protein U1763_02560 [Sphingomonas sp. LB2R24]|uniref:GTP pyrophosphokinase n=1 Tax=Sphingomonas sorbitolis TaxID=3096165 RepID=UPI002FCBA5E8